MKKQRHHIADKGPYSQSYSFPVVVYRYACWTIKKAEHQRIDSFELWCWRRLGMTDAEAEILVLWPPDTEN